MLLFAEKALFNRESILSKSCITIGKKKSIIHKLNFFPIVDTNYSVVVAAALNVRDRAET